MKRIYIVEGITLQIPLRYDERTGRYLEVYPDFMEQPVWTTQGHRVMFAGEDACSHARESEPGGCPDCGSCRFYRRAGAHTWVGVCVNPFCQQHQKMEEST